MENLLPTILSVVLSGVITVFVFYKGYRKPLSAERFEKVVAPIFFILEPYLFNIKDEKHIGAVLEVCLSI